MPLRSAALGLFLLSGASAVHAADSYSDIDAALFVCDAKAQAIKLAKLGLQEESMRDFVLADNSGCSLWKSPAMYRVVPGTASNGIQQIQIDEENRVGTDPGLAWITQQQLDFAEGKQTTLVRLDKAFLACNTLEGAKQNIPASMRAAKAGLAVIGASDGTRANPTKNYACTRVEPVTYAIGYRDSVDSGFARYRLFDDKASDVWMLKFW